MQLDELSAASFGDGEGDASSGRFGGGKADGAPDRFHGGKADGGTAGRPRDDGEEPESGPADWFGEDAVALMRANDELLQTRRSIVDMLAEMEHIVLLLNPRIEAEWQVVVGVWENNLLEAQIAMRRAKRKCNLVQARVNAGEAVDDARIELQLDWEFSEWTEQLESATETYDEAVESRMSTVYMGDDDARDLKKVFRTLAKRLHPDLNPSLDERHKRLFTLAETAYRRGDVTVLRSLEVSTRDLEDGVRMPSTLIESQAELAVAQTQAQEVHRRLQELKQERPYSLRALLDDEAWVEDHVEQLKREIDDCRYNERRYLARCNQLAGEGGARSDG